MPFMTRRPGPKLLDCPSCGLAALLPALAAVATACTAGSAGLEPAPVELARQALVASPKKIAYYPVWSSAGDDTAAPSPQAPSSLPWGKLTHVNLAFVGINSSWGCAWVDETGAPAPSFQSNAQALINYRNANFPGVKILLSVGGWTMSYRFSEAMSAANRTAFVNACVSLVSTMGADGLDLDWEYPTSLGAGNCPSGHTCQSASDPANLTATLTQLRAQAGFSGKLLTAALAANRAGAGGNIPYEYQNFFTGSPQRFDWVNIMTYDFHGTWETVVGFSAPYDLTLQALDYVVKGPNGVDDTTDGVGSANKGKVVMGIPFYGPAWYGVATPGASGVGNAGTALGTVSFTKAKANFVDRFPTQCTVTAPTSGNTQNRYAYCTGNVSFCVGAVGNGSSSTCSAGGGTWTTRSNVWLSYEDTSAVGNKADAVATNNWGGAMWWTAGEDTAAGDLTTAIHNKLTPATQSPFGGTARAIPGPAIEAEDYDVGGEGVAFHDTTLTAPCNSGNAYRTGAGDCVDIQPTGGTDPGGFNVGWAAAGEWLEYTVNVATTGSYTMELRVAATAATRTVHVEVDGATVGGTIAIPNTGNYQTYQTVSVTVSLTAGQRVLRLVHDTGSANVNWIRFTAVQGPSYQYFEAEAGTGANTAPMSVVADANASGGQFTWSATTTSNTGVPANGHVTFAFTAPAAGTYNLWGRFLVGPATSADDSLWVRIDTGTWVAWNEIYNRLGNAAYGWERVHDTPNGNALVSYSLTAGAHTLEIAYRESGLKIDRFLITNDLAFTP
jgi:GH18 family chitinase